MRIKGRASTAGFTLPHSLEIQAIAICAAPTAAAGGKAGTTGERPVARAYRYGPAAAACSGKTRFGEWRRIWSVLQEARQRCPVARSAQVGFGADQA